MAATKYMKEPNILGVYSIQHIVDELCKPIVDELVSNNKENVVFPRKYMYIRKLIPVVLDLHNVQYSSWSTLFRDAARANNLLHHIDPTFSTPSTIPDINIITSMDDDDTIIWCRQDAILLTWIYATISPYLLIRLVGQDSYSTSAMDAWARLRDICQQHDAAMHKKKRRFIHIDLNEDYDQGVEDDDDRVDLLSGLPDDLLIYMLSLTTDFKTAGRTSILSKRWTHLWTQLMALNFNDNETSATIRYYGRFAQPGMDKFVDSVNRVIGANQAPYLNTFRIHFPLNTSYAAHIDKWVKFAFDKEVRNLDLSFTAASSKILFNPALILNTTLESLHLKSVSIKGPLLQWVTTNCLNLQCLSFHSCMASADDASSSRHPLKLVISSPKLKRLEFFHCLKLLNIDTLHLSAPNLASFTYCDFKIHVEYRSVPSLVDVTFGGSYLHHLDTLSGFSAQLEKLSIVWDKACASSRFLINSGFPTFINVQQLEIVYFQQDLYLLSVTSLIEVCPLMHTFKLKLMCREQIERPMQILAPNNAQLKAIPSHQHLKAVEYLGYAGCASAAELALCLTRHAPMLRRFIFDTRQPPQYIGKPSEVYRNQIEIVRRTELLAKQIRSSQGLADVVIL